MWTRCTFTNPKTSLNKVRKEDRGANEGLELLRCRDWFMLRFLHLHVFLGVHRFSDVADLMIRYMFCFVIFLRQPIGRALPVKRNRQF